MLNEDITQQWHNHLLTEDTLQGWFITYIDRDSETFFKEKMKNKRIRADLVDEEKQEREIKRQIERAEQMTPNGVEAEAEQQPKVLVRSESDKNKIKLKIGPTSKNVVKEKGESSKLAVEEVETDNKQEKLKKNDNGKSSGRSALAELMREQEKAKERINRRDYWLREGIVVKVVSIPLAAKGYYKQKGVVRKVVDKYVGEIEMIESKHVLRVRQEEVETVIFQVGGLVRIVNGAYRGSNARLMTVVTNKFCAKVQIEKGVYAGRVLPAVEYEDICKVVQ